MSTYRPLIISHRGAKCESPENTIAAFDRALSYPIDGIEFDVQLTKDGIPVIYHDRTLWKVSGQRRHIPDMRLDELQNLDFGSWYNKKFKGTPIPTFEVTLKKFIPRTHLYIEIKSRPWDKRNGSSARLTDMVIEYLRKRRKSNGSKEPYILSFDRELLNRVLNKDRLIKCILNVVAPRHLTESQLAGYPDVWGVCTNINRLTNKFARMIHNQGKKLLVYTCVTPAQVKKAIKAESDAILTDNPKWLFTYLEKEKIF